MKRLQIILLSLASLILIALLIAPQTRWLVRPQIAPGLINYAQSRRQFVQNHPNDYPVQLAGNTYDTAQTQLQYARSLVPRFPESASLRANILRYAMMHEIRLNRADSNGGLLGGKPDPPLVYDRNNPPPTPAQLAAFDADAAAGERLDPNNAYFPFMRSIGLFAAHRDAEGLDAVRRASEEHLWREYYNDEVEGHWRILEGIYGHREALGSMAFSAVVLYPHYGALRAVARLVTVKAVQEEQAGHRAEGLALRRSLARCGDLMRAQGTSYIANLVGTAICSITWLRPGDEAPITYEARGYSPEIGRQIAQKRLDAYCKYVTQLGHPDAAREARAQAKAGEQIRHLSLDVISGSQLKDIGRLAICLITDRLVVTSVLLFLLLGFAAWGLSRLPRIRERRPLPAGASIGIWAALLLRCMGLVSSWQADMASTAFLLLVLGLVPIAAFSLYAVFQPAIRRPFSQAVLAGLVTFVVLSLIIGLVAWRTYGAPDILMTLQMFSSSDSGPTMPIPSSATAAVTVTLAILMVIPLLLIVILSIAARVRHVPVSVGLTEGFRAWTPAIVFLLVALYGGLTLWTVRQENAVNYGLERSLHGEGQYIAQLTGQPWPGPVQ